jgi:hypothetical protein
MYNFILIIFGFAFACLILSPFLLFKWLNAKKDLLEKRTALELLNAKHSTLIEENQNLKEVEKEVFKLRKVLEKKNDLFSTLESNNINTLTRTYPVNTG